ncbi:transcriptional regulator, TetR family [Desulfarculus baarsii DSM 2075]|uniref:Transcriptional regulator, TetR family n=1 Tax=Desulfarculus baarsii (strain ATCC 33931 / DSM 2075 / LMG 7858 / VKM B-1802 / 2st14) TaxID=644282 RepID=E1QHM9_DESB2|nr:TetR/AcrR family transcriptional regulator [Desulfarculus baarsii]ADK85072.1 transcriptional regulator, TetR family [Desulfarculus baarsii DSM 2075]
MNFAEFNEMVSVSWVDMCQRVYEEHGESIRIKKGKTVAKNLPRIFEATLRISNQHGFQAMSMRALSRETGLSMGALYAYFSSKEELLELLQRAGRSMTMMILGQCLEKVEGARERLRVAIEAHLFLSEAMQQWFYFSYMEAKHLGPEEKDKAMAGELQTENMVAEIIRAGQAEGVFIATDAQLLAACGKALMQDWYVKRWKYAKRGVSVDQYARFVIEMVEAYCLAPAGRQ